MQILNMKILFSGYHDLIIAGMKYLLNDTFNNIDYKLCESKKDIINTISLYPDSLIILDYTNLDFAAIDEIEFIAEKSKNTRFLFLSESFTPALLKRIISSGYNFSIMTGDCNEEDFIYCIRKIIKGEKFIDNKLYNKIIDSVKVVIEEQKHILSLTNAEKAILKEIALGKTTKEIAEERNLSFHTINTHRKNIFRKINVNNVKEAIKYAMRAGIIDIIDYSI